MDVGYHVIPQHEDRKNRDPLGDEAGFVLAPLTKRIQSWYALSSRRINNDESHLRERGMRARRAILLPDRDLAADSLSKFVNLRGVMLTQ